MAIRGVGGQSAVDFSQVDNAQSASSAASAAPAHRTAHSGYLPGDKATVSGQYVLVDSSNKQVGKQITMTAGTQFPPARAGLSFKLVDATKHSDATGMGGTTGGKPG